MPRLRLKYAPSKNYFTLQYRGGTRPCLFAPAFKFDGDVVALVDGSSLPAGRMTVAYLTIPEAA
jgi:hypothetical protein